ncbi:MULTISPECIES: DUF362 domain-containing protein [Clostridium]|uniref:Ferredoxin n=1 Tax=Clostridium ragsdalei P11 TaxID=1353534 RepID=A0A1A6B1I0_9CLOT|nr:MULTISPECIES: 4Fe-4S binding protein [Clostridium]OBR96206.1 ferredoxin [Clostridium ragsdalei P11]QXE18672.1 hypothetical protein B5S50_07385 [Clostridium sp. 001]
MNATMRYFITLKCIKCHKCANECPVDAIYEGNDKFEINDTKCITCDKCREICPVDAIHYEDDEFRSINREMDSYFGGGAWPSPGRYNNLE